MNSKEINSGITLTESEAAAISKKLVAAGIDRALVERVIIGHVMEDTGCGKDKNCVHTHPCNGYRVAKGCSKENNCVYGRGCDRYFKTPVAAGCPKATNCHHDLGCDRYFRSAGPTDIEDLKRQILERKIDLKSIHPKAEKLFR